MGSILFGLQVPGRDWVQFTAIGTGNLVGTIDTNHRNAPAVAPIFDRKSDFELHTGTL